MSKIFDAYDSAKFSYNCIGVCENPITHIEKVEDESQTEIGYQDCADALLKMWMDNILTDAEFNRIIDRLNKDRDKIKCPKCGRSDYIKSFKDWGIDGGIYKYKCINCNTYIKGEVRDE